MLRSGGVLLVAVLIAVLALTGCPKAPAPSESTPVATPKATDEPEPETEAEPEPEPGPTEKAEYDMGDVPQFDNGYIVRAVVPPEGSVSETDQWPPVLWFDVNGTKLVMYARHEQGYDPETESGKLTVWIGCPWEYIEEVEEDHPFGPEDAAAYLAKAGIKSVGAEVYIGPGDKSGPGVGYQEWTSATDRCVVCELEPKRNREHMERITSWAITDQGQVDLYRGVLPCRCPEYPDETVDEDWIYVLEGKTIIYVADQYGLPGCSPMPES